MITPNDIADRLEELVGELFPGETVHRDLVEHGFARPCTLIVYDGGEVDPGYFAGLAADSLVQPGYTVDIDVEAQEQYLMSRGIDTSEMSEQELREADTGSHVFLKISCKILDAIEDIDIDITI